jgi:translocation and assembly module TamB
MNLSAKKILRKTGKVLAWIVASIIFLIVLVYILIQIPAVQNFAKNKVVAYLEKKIGTKVTIRHLSLKIPSRLVLEGVYFEDQKRDTLLAADKLQVDIAMLRLLKSEVNVSYLGLEGMNANVYRLGKDTTFNFQYILDAFTSEQTKEPETDTSASTLKFNLDKIELDRIRATYHDDQTGNDVVFYLGHFDTKIKTFDLAHSIYEIPDINLSGIRSSVRQYKPLMTSTSADSVAAATDSAQALDLRLKNISLKDVQFSYNNTLQSLAADLNLGELTTDIKNLNLKTLLIQLNKIELNNTKVKLHMGKSEQARMVANETAEAADSVASNPWRVELGKLLLANNDLQFDNDNQPRQKTGMDYAHLNIKGLNTDIDSLVLTPDEYKGNVANISFMEQSGFDLQQLKTDFYYGPKQAYLNNLVFKTPGSALGDKISISYPSIASLATHIGDLYIDADLNNSQLSIRDLLTFAPQMEAQLPAFAKYKNATLKLNTNIRGYVKDLSIPVLQLSGIGSTNISMSGTIKNLPDAKRLTMDLRLANFRTTRADIESFLPKGSLPSNIRLPEFVAAQGSVSGNTGNLGGKLNIQTNKGTASVNGTFNANTKSYNATLALNNLDAGYFTKQEAMLGRVSLTATAKGQGYDPKTMNAVVNATLREAYVQGYNYTNLKLNAAVRRGNAVVKANMNDRNIAFDLNTTINNLSAKFPSVKLDLLLDTLNLQKLKVMPANYRLKGHVIADLPSTNPDSLAGTINIERLVFMDSVKMYQVDSVDVAAELNGTQRNITLSSQFASLNLNGTYKLTEIGSAMQDIINRYYALPGYKAVPYSPQDWVLAARITPAGLLANMFPQLKGTDTIGMRLDFNSTANSLNFITRAPKIIFGEQKIDSLTLIANNTETNRIDYGLTMSYAGSPTFFVNKTSLTGSFANDVLDANLDIKDAKQQSKYQLGLLVNALNGGSQIKASIKPALLLNYDKWAATEGNYVQYDSTGIIVNNLVISKDGQSLSIASQSLSTTAPLEVKFANFQIGTLSKFANQALPVDGTINGNAVARNVMTNPVFTSDLAISNLTYGKDTVGNIAVKVDNETANAYNADVSITGFDNDVRLTGKYYTGESRMDLNLAVNNLALATLRKLAPDQLSAAGGSLKGNVAVKGTLDRPSIIGEMRFVKAYLTPTMLGERFTLDNEAIVVSTRDIIFDNFTITDSLGSKAVIDGNIYTTDFQNFRFDMDITARNFEAINAPQRSGAMFYGKLNLNTDLKIRGTLGAPSVTASLRINKATDLSIVLPSENPEIVSRDGIIRFVDYDSVRSSVTVINPLDTIIQSELKGLDLTANIETDTAAQFTVVIDETTGDALKIRGKADLAAAMDKSGKISLTGDYSVNSGSYQLSVSVLKRRFEIQRGSTLTWTGDPTSANVNITALYLARTAPIDLMQNQPGNLTTYNQKLPFNVYLKMNGELLKPQISFDIQLPSEEATQWQRVEEKLAQVRADEAELNKQVFALLLLGRFVGENPFASAGEGTATSTMVRQTASGILSDQLNKLAGSLVSGVDLNFGLNSEDDYSTGTRATRTDLTVGVSKSLLNDRLKVSVGSNFELEGPQNTNRATTNIAGDLAVDYQVSRDGRYRLRAYRKNRYEGVIEGQVIETGVGFIFTLDYDSFKEIFQRPSEAEREQRKQIKQVEKQKEKAEKEIKEKQEAADTAHPNTSAPLQRL